MYDDRKHLVNYRPDRKDFMKDLVRVIAARLASPLFIVYCFEAIAVCLFFGLVFGLFGHSLETQLDIFELIGFCVLGAWLLQRINKVIHIPDYILNLCLRLLLEAPIAGSPGRRRVQLEDLCQRHLLSFRIAVVAFFVVSLPALVLLAVFSLTEDSLVTSIVWKWTYRCALALMMICLAGITGPLFHARRWGCVKEVSSHLGWSKA